MIIEVGTPRYKELFGFRDFLNQPFESRLPPHKLLVEALGDPSKSIAAIDEIIGDANPNGILHAAGLQDLQLGAQVLMHARVAASRFGGKLTLPGNGTLSSLTEGLVDVMKSIKIPARASAEDVQIFLADTAFAIGMKALGAIGPVGKIAAAILGFARGIIQIVKQRRELATMDAERREALAYAKLPPLQEPDVQVDAWYVDAVLKANMETGSWTAIFSPRFDSDEWVGVYRNGGIACAPGKAAPGVNELGKPAQVFETSGGIGFVPGLDQITSVIQVAKDHRELAGWNGGGRWPIRPEMVIDVGKYFVNTGRLAALAWSWATEVDASPDLYKIHIAALHEKWKRYCDGGRRFLLDGAQYWKGKVGKGETIDNPVPIFGSAIACAIGAWRCLPKDNGYSLLTAGLRGDDIRGPAIGREVLGCVMDPPSMDAFASGKACFTTIYEERIQSVLDEARRRQSYFLRHSLVAAYVRADFDAFQDPQLRDALMKARKTLLEHPDRYLIQLDDVADDEPGLPGDGKTWKNQLIARGVKRRPPFLAPVHGRIVGRQPGTIDAPTEPPPRVPIYEGPLAWGEIAGASGDGDDTKSDHDDDSNIVDTSSPRWRLAAMAIGGVLLGGGAYALARRAEKGR